MNRLDTQYTELLKLISEYGILKSDRTGTGTKSIFGYTIRHKMSEGFPLLTTKRMAWKSIVTELLWFLRGDTNIRYLIDNGCHIWDGDAYKNYQNRDGKCYCGHTTICDCGDIPKEEFIERIQTDDEFAERWGSLGKIYGKQWRKWNGEIDQIQNLINELKTNPDSRRLMVSAWNVGELGQMVLPPCHYGFQCYTRELSLKEREKLCSDLGGTWDLPFTEKVADKWNVPKRSLSLMWNQRSVDTFLGLPFNIASYGLLLGIIAKEVNMIPDELIGNLGDTHLYLNHLEQATEQIGREPYPLPTLSITGDGGFAGYSPTDFQLIGYESHPAIKAPLSN